LLNSIQRKPTVDNQHARARRDIRPLGTKLGECRQATASCLYSFETLIGCRLIVGSDMKPDID